MKTFASFLVATLLFVSSGGDISTALAQQDPPRLANISTRGQALTGDNVMIGGFIIGSGPAKTVVIRARGPSLAQFGVPGVMANPTLRLFSGQTEIGANDDYTTAPNLGILNASGFAPTDSREPAILTTLPPGPYTAIVSGVGDTTGVAIVEVFEVDAVATPLLNISTRGQVLTGDDVMIGGFIVQGSGPQTVVVRARGPSLQAAGVSGVLADPTLTIYSGSTPIASNDDYGTAANLRQLMQSGFAPSNGYESAILATLAPGGYTAIVQGVGNATGIGIVEVFAAPAPGAGGETTKPFALSSSPPNNALQASVVDPIVVTFSEPMDPGSIYSKTFTITGPNGPVAGTWSTNGSIATFTPHQRLETARQYAVAVTTGAHDLAGNTLAFPYAVNFTTSVTEPTPIVAGCPAPEPDALVRRVEFGSSETVRRPSGKILTQRVPQSPSGRASVSYLQTQSAATPGGTLTEITYSRCPGVIETNLHPSCMASTNLTTAQNHTVFHRPLSQFGWTTQDQHAAQGCLMTTQEQAYINIRWTFPSCGIGDGNCGFALSWAEGAY